MTEKVIGEMTEIAVTMLKDIGVTPVTADTITRAIIVLSDKADMTAKATIDHQTAVAMTVRAITVQAVGNDNIIKP